MKKIFTLITLAFTITAGLSSCTLIGYGIGTTIDHGSAHGTVAVFSDIDDYSWEKARIIYPDSSVRYATYVGYSDEPVGNYRNAFETYLKLHSGDTLSLPIGKTVITENFIGDNVTKYSGLFDGYYPEGIMVNGEKLNLKQFDGITSPIHLSRAQLKVAFESNTIPIRATLNFQTRENSFSLTNRDFKNVMILPHSTYGRWIGLGIGAVLDFVIIELVMKLNDSWKHGII